MRVSKTWEVLRWLPMAVLLCVVSLSSARAADIHQGVASCAGGICHASTHPLGNSGIRRDEYFIWQQRDPHAGATATLAGERSRRIGAALGLDPQTAPQCLACHADAIAPAQRGERWLATDGIGCEVCHGGSERWLAEHSRPGLSLAQKTALGMTATWQPEVRAALCLDCHQGDAAHPISHAMMAAGHPPLLFELDTFSALQPPHYDRDADYAQRKGAADAARDWALGQALAADRLLASLAQGQLGQGLMPELMYFDCEACHHPLTAGRWQPGRNAGTAPGTPPLADAALYWLGLWLQVAAPEAAGEWHRQLVALQTSTGQGQPALQAAARAARGQLQERWLPLLRERQLNATQLKSLLRAIAGTGESVRGRDFLAAQQAAMASLVIADALRQRGDALTPAQGRATEALYAAVRERERFNPGDYQAAMRRLRDSIP
ncbi:MAG: hypothetical protein EPN60_11500 [Nevskiaceae bacterium]|jgi:hypothetical protein|nr:MAG: hypothetical protein EPO48_11420 [Nevskiaceae bacterium]TAM25796.1 MAG: hypothetical protein EPN60_11500 [Nevskiaceae bacterium]